MKKIICIFITLLMALSFVSCSADSNRQPAEETASAKAGQSASDVTLDETETETQMTEYQSSVGVIAYPAAYEDEFIIEEQQEAGEQLILFSTQIDGEAYPLFNLVISDDASDSEWTVTDKDGATHAVSVVMSELETDGLTQQQQDKLFSMQECVNEVLSNLQ